MPEVSLGGGAEAGPGGSDHPASAGGPGAKDQDPDHPDHPHADPAHPFDPTYLADAIGGVRGVVDATVPTVAFVALNAIVGLTAGLVVAVAAAVVILLLRLIRREPLQQAFSGLFGVVVAVVIAARMHSASGFYLPGIAKNAGYLAIGLVSLIVRRPLAGYVLAAFDHRYRSWRGDPALRRAAAWATLIWVGVFGLRVVVQGALYLADRPGWLAAANLGLGLPLFGLAILATVAVVRRLAPDSADGPAEPEPAVEVAAVLDALADDLVSDHRPAEDGAGDDRRRDAAQSNGSPAAGGVSVGELAVDSAAGPPSNAPS